MVYIKHWPEYQAAALALLEASPVKTRYVIKLRPKDQWLVLKVTDDRTTLKFKTRSQAILNRFEALTKDFLARAAGAEGPISVDQTRRHNETVQGHLAHLVSSSQAASASPAPGASASADASALAAPGASKKKKKGKK